MDWKPFQIDPGTNTQGEKFEAYCQRRWGGSGWTNHLMQEGRKDGATFQNWKWWPNTLKAHQLISFAEKKGVSTNLCNSVLFKAEYEEGKNISLTEVLVQIAKDELNLPEDVLRPYLEADEGATEVVADIQRGRRKHNISGVPFFVISRDEDNSGQQYTLSGAQSHNKFVSVFKSLGRDDG